MAQVDKPFAGGNWTKAKYRGFIVSALREASLRWPVKHDVLNAAKRDIGPELKRNNPRCKFEYQCASCTYWFIGKQVNVDHIEELGDILQDPGGYIGRLFCEADGMQILCHGCHLAKHPRKKK